MTRIRGQIAVPIWPARRNGNPETRCASDCHERCTSAAIDTFDQGKWTCFHSQGQTSAPCRTCEEPQWNPKACTEDSLLAASLRVQPIMDERVLILYGLKSMRLECLVDLL
ncbi:hypothetical protein P0D69_19680 [Paraburkholderia sediminicola]|uniref:hypothetical protein n=1 Tax=Paraburkholderia sediminicola TaxID=458836 RepID=UPI0038BC369C